MRADTEQKAEILRLKKTGLKLTEIANLTNLTYNYVRYYIYVRLKDVENVKGNRPKTAERLHAAAIDYYERGLTHKQTRKKHKLTDTDMQEIRRIYGAQFPNKRPGKKKAAKK